jgi:SAM-dependent methyltransferase
MSTPIEHTGERMVPESSSGYTLWEHLYRYQFATRYIKGRNVLDIACGEGYGTFALQAAGAVSVIGMDVSEETCQHARSKYDIDARVADATAIPLDNDTLDVVVSFETIEHITEPDQFLRECARILRPAGTLVISTPNVDAFNPGRSAENNPYHCSEMTREEFCAALARHFDSFELYCQVPVSAPSWSWGNLLTRETPLRYLRGYHRLIASKFPGADPLREKAARVNPVAEVLRIESRWHRFLNPYAVRRHSPKSKVVPLYYVAVAKTACT